MLLFALPQWKSRYFSNYFLKGRFLQVNTLTSYLCICNSSLTCTLYVCIYIYTYYNMHILNIPIKLEFRVIYFILFIPLHQLLPFPIPSLAYASNFMLPLSFKKQKKKIYLKEWRFILCVVWKASSMETS